MHISTGNISENVIDRANIVIAIKQEEPYTICIGTFTFPSTPFRRSMAKIVQILTAISLEW